MHDGIHTGVLVFAGIYVALAWAGFRWARARVNRRARELASSLGASGVTVVGQRSTPSIRMPAELDVERQGRRGRLTVRQWGRDGQLITLWTSAPSMPPIWLRRERGIDHVAKALGIEREVELGIPDFDSSTFISSNAPDEMVRRALAGTETRRLVREILEQGWTVSFSKEGVSASRLAGIWRPFDASAMPAILDRLQALAASLPELGGVEVRSLKPPVGSYAVLLPAFASIFLPTILAVSGLREVVHVPPDDHILVGALAAGLVPWFLIVMLLARRLNRRPLAMLEIPALAFALVATVPFLSAFALFYVNSAADHGAPVLHHTRVADWYKHNRGTVYLWDGVGSKEKVILPPSVLPVQIGDALDVESRPGAFGWMWISSVTRPPRDAFPLK
jgi:hypothetical protein